MRINADMTMGAVEIKQYQATNAKGSESLQENGTGGERFQNFEGSHDFVEAIEKANHIEVGKTECQFSIHEKTKQIMIKVVDKTTKEIVKEIPAEKVLDMVAKMCELAGVFVDEKR